MREEDDRSGAGHVGITVYYLSLLLWSIVGLTLGGIGGLSPDFEKILNNWRLGFCHYQGYWVGFGLLLVGLAITYVGRQHTIKVLRRK